MDANPLDMATGDVVYIELTSPLRYDDGNGGEELRHAIRLQVDEISEIGIAGMGAENDVAIVPSKSKDFDKIGGERIEFFPWSSVLRISVLYKYAEYQRVWDEYDAQENL